MKTARLMSAVLAVVAFPSTAPAQTIAEVAQHSAGGNVRWDWVGNPPSGSLIASFVRADVRVFRSNTSEIEVHVTSPDPDANGSSISLIVARDNEGLKIFDRYPPSAHYLSHECLPPDDEHGGPWNYDDRILVTLVVPRDLTISVKTRAGTVDGI